MCNELHTLYIHIACNRRGVGCGDCVSLRRECACTLGVVYRSMRSVMASAYTCRHTHSYILATPHAHVWALIWQHTCIHMQCVVPSSPQPVSKRGGIIEWRQSRAHVDHTPDHPPTLYTTTAQKCVQLMAPYIVCICVCMGAFSI